jgi:hypothetical protein
LWCHLRADPDRLDFIKGYFKEKLVMAVESASLPLKTAGVLAASAAAYGDEATLGH